MPLDSKDKKGTEKDGSKSSDYCTYCCQNGDFSNPDMHLSEMKTLIKTQMEK